MVAGENQPYAHLYLKNCLIPFTANDDHNEMIQYDSFITLFKHSLTMIVVNVKIQSQLVGQFMFPDMSLVIRYSCRGRCDSTDSIFVKSKVSMDSAIGYHRGKM